MGVVPSYWIENRGDVDLNTIYTKNYEELFIQ